MIEAAQCASVTSEMNLLDAEMIIDRLGHSHHVDIVGEMDIARVTEVLLGGAENAQGPPMEEVAGTEVPAQQPADSTAMRIYSSQEDHPTMFPTFNSSS